MKKAFFLLFFSLIIFSTPSCVKEVIKEVVVRDTITSILRDTITVSLSDSASLKKGLLAYFPFNGNFNDESGNGNNATALNGAFLTNDIANRLNSAAGFDGVNDYLIVPDNSKLMSDTVTISLMFYANDWNAVRSLIAMHNFQTSSAFTYNIVQPFAGSNQLNFSVGNPADACTNVQPYDSGLGIFSSTLVSANRWYHVLATFAGGQQKLYIDGALVASKVQSFQKLKKCNSAQLVIGGWWQNSMFMFSGKIDEVRIYSRLLNASELKVLFAPFKYRLVKS